MNCYQPRWTDRICEAPNCAAQGSCNGSEVSVKCVQLLKNDYGYQYDKREATQMKKCTRACMRASCGTANNIAAKYKPTALCSLGSASAVANTTSLWAWTCMAHDGNASCQAQKIVLEQGRCGASYNNSSHDSLSSTNGALCNYGTVVDFTIDTSKYVGRWSWKCRGDE